MRAGTILFALGILCSPPVGGQAVVQSRGVDGRVDYGALTAYGPWDDRNYELTRDDLALLADNEEELELAIPVFYRVELRRRLDLPRRGPVQYPSSALPQFLAEHGGFLIGGRLQQRARWQGGGRYEVVVAPDPEAPRPSGPDPGEVRVTFPAGAAESAIAINPRHPELVIAGSNGPGHRQQMHLSADGGASWVEVDLPLGGTCCDPTVSWSADGMKAYAATLGGGFAGIWFYRSTNGGRSWDSLALEPGGDPRREIGERGADKEYLHVDVGPESPYRDTIYLTWHERHVVRTAFSRDLGHTWSDPLGFEHEPRGVGGDLTSDAAGTVYLLWPSFSQRSVVVKRSIDGGVSFTPAVTVAETNAAFTYRLPSQESRQVAIVVSADTDLSQGPHAGTVYAAWNDTAGPERPSPGRNHSQIKVASSRDGGSTWAISIPHTRDDLSKVDRWQPWLRVGSDGVVHVVFYDTRFDPTRRSVDLFHATSSDGGRSWSTAERLSSTTSPNVSGVFELGDYNGLDIVGDRLVAAFTDNRDETGSGRPSRDIYAVGRDLGVLFADDFETDSLSAWSLSQPQQRDPVSRD